MVLVTTEGPALPPAIRNRLQCLPPHQQADLYFVYRHELENEGAARNSTTDWLRRLQRAREFSWLATVPPEERHRYASLPAEDRRLLAEMHRTCASDMCIDMCIRHVHPTCTPTCASETVHPHVHPT